MPKPKTKPTPHQDAMMYSEHWDIAERWAKRIIGGDRNCPYDCVKDCEEQGILAAGVVFHLMKCGKAEEAARFFNAMIASLEDPEDD